MTTEIKPQTSLVTANGDAIAMSELLKANGTITYHTDQNASVTLSLDILRKLTPKPNGASEPSTADLMMFGYTCVSQSLNPYLKECWLVWMGSAQGYQPIVSAQKRIAKAQSMPDYDGYEWGWISADGMRHESGQQSTLKSQQEVVGAWGRVHRKNQKVPFYHEVFLSEYHTKNGKPITMLLKTCRDQTHRFAYADQMGNLLTENEAKFAAFEPNGREAVTSRSQKLLDGDTDDGQGRQRSPVSQHEEEGGQQSTGLPGRLDNKRDEVRTGGMDQGGTAGGEILESECKTPGDQPDAAGNGQEPDAADGEGDPVVDWLYYCPECDRGFDYDSKTTVKKIKNTQVACCPHCKTTNIQAWEDHVLDVAAA